MEPTLTTEEIAALGLAGRELGEAAVVSWPEDATARGLVKEMALWLAASVPALQPAAAVELKAGGERHEVRVSVGEGQSLGVSSPDPARWRHAGGDPGVVECDLTDGPVLMVLPGGEEWVLAFRSRELRAIPVAPRLLSVEPLAEIAPPPASWIAEVADEWLADLAQQRLAAGGAWQNTVVVGLLARLPRLSPEQGRRAVEDALRGRVDERVAQPRRWARELTPEQVRTLEDLAVARCSELCETLATLEAEPHPSDPAWVATLVRMCHGRDDLECVRLLLCEADAQDRLEDSLEPLDEMGLELVGSLPFDVGVADERLQRVAALDPEAWWARPASEAEGV